MQQQHHEQSLLLLLAGAAVLHCRRLWMTGQHSIFAAWLVKCSCGRNALMLQLLLAQLYFSCCWACSLVAVVVV